ncbi:MULTISPECIES: ATP-binding protein [unclassified Variovorax]|uniref:sensor histidine kinase n=1 Tax=unclassified Variovorax TaxID=663243 RepID=UPI00076BCB5B|nr:MULTISPECIES: ATP-binding protein [unclassified Variovorax]KWT78636.1 histidine kinase [Variovorax sp. WDL1]PNG53516.1 C4-dicarboxylate transport sensor protein DctB [Variovorax sp. B4]VTV10936.1 C4-dicarboxylate transport sensor protein DctB [Variovorax sp. WDL1]
MLRLSEPYRASLVDALDELREHPVPRAHWPRWAAVGVWGCLVAAAGALAYLAAERAGIRSLQQGTLHRLDIYATGLRSELSRYEYLPQVLSLSPDVLDLLRSPGDNDLRRDANVYLETVNVHAQASASYVMDEAGLTLAASNWSQPGSFVHMNFSYRPYFRDAMGGVPGRFYGIGTVSREAGYYFSFPVSAEGRRLGVATVKVGLDKLDAPWANSADKVLAIDRNGVVVLSSVAAWKFRTLRPLSTQTLQQLAQTRQYTEAGTLTPLAVREHRPWSGGAATVVQIGADGPGGKSAAERFGSDLLLDSRAVDGTDWKLIMLSDMGPVHAFARTAAVVTMFALVFLMLLVMFFQQRRRIAHHRLAAREALQRAYDELEHKVQLRTEALSDANQHLQTEVAERKRAEEILKTTLEDLVQTGKMAVLGQMSAGITHELNQPLAALRTLSANAVVFLQRGQGEQVDLNLRTICQLTDRMGQITAQLKKFARRSGVELQPVPLADVIADAVFLLGQRIREEHIQLEQKIEPGLCALCEGNRLEQVLVNLLVNAFDATAAGGPPRRVRIVARRTPEGLALEVHDNGQGIAPEVMPRLFEPFFTTKEQGRGLGLGLAISAGIVRDFGGMLRSDRSKLGGATFIVTLRNGNCETTHD